MKRVCLLSNFSQNKSHLDLDLFLMIKFYSTYNYSKCVFQKDERGMETYVNTIMNRIETTTDLEGSLEECDLVVEAIPEDLQLKQTMFAKLDKVYCTICILDGLVNIKFVPGTFWSTYFITNSSFDSFIAASS
jgi:hypothetical protein